MLIEGTVYLTAGVDGFTLAGQPCAARLDEIVTSPNRAATSGTCSRSDIEWQPPIRDTPLGFGGSAGRDSRRHKRASAGRV